METVSIANIIAKSTRGLSTLRPPFQLYEGDRGIAMFIVYCRNPKCIMEPQVVTPEMFYCSSHCKRDCVACHGNLFVLSMLQVNEILRRPHGPEIYLKMTQKEEKGGTPLA